MARYRLRGMFDLRTITQAPNVITGSGEVSNVRQFYVTQHSTIPNNLPTYIRLPLYPPRTKDVPVHGIHHDTVRKVLDVYRDAPIGDTRALFSGCIRFLCRG